MYPQALYLYSDLLIYHLNFEQMVLIDLWNSFLAIIRKDRKVETGRTGREDKIIKFNWALRCVHHFLVILTETFKLGGIDIIILVVNYSSHLIDEETESQKGKVRPMNWTQVWLAQGKSDLHTIIPTFRVRDPVPNQNFVINCQCDLKKSHKFSEAISTP